MGPSGPTGPAGPSGPSGPAGSATGITGADIQTKLAGLAGTGTQIDSDTVDTMHAAGGTDSTKDLKALIAKTACEARGGQWADGTGCTEYVTLACGACSWSAAQTNCGAGRHLCTVLDMYYAGFRSIEAQGLRRSSPKPYLWLQGHAGNNQIYYPWSSGEFACSAGTAPMYYLSAATQASITGAFGCYSQSYTNAIGACCLDGR